MKKSTLLNLVLISATFCGALPAKPCITKLKNEYDSLKNKWTTRAILEESVFCDSELNDLHEATKKGNLHSVTHLIANGYAKVDQLNDRKETALSIAAYQGDLLLVEALLEKGADVNKESYYLFPLEWAIRGLAESAYGIPEWQILDFGLKIRSYPVLNRAKFEVKYSFNTYVSIVESLIEGKENIEMTGSLFKSIRMRLPEVVELLIKNNVDLNTKNLWGDTPLMVAAEYGFTEIVTLLVENGADIHSKNVENTALSRACASESENKVECIQILIQNGALANLTPQELEAYHQTLIPIFQGVDEEWLNGVFSYLNDFENCFSNTPFQN